MYSKSGEGCYEKDDFSNTNNQLTGRIFIDVQKCSLCYHRNETRQTVFMPQDQVPLYSDLSKPNTISGTSTPETDITAHDGMKPLVHIFKGEESVSAQQEK